jgi:hypothetical protein
VWTLYAAWRFGGKSPAEAWGVHDEPLFPSRVEALMQAFSEYAALQESLVGDFVVQLGQMSGNL